ncbi:MAG: magnesium transporter [Candidatus Helarchaeota archaeon]
MSIKKTSFWKNFRQSFFALILQPVGLIAGLIIASLSPVFGAVPWIFIIFQPFLSNIGNIGGIYCGNLSTSLHLGSIEPRIRNNTKIFKTLVSSIITLSFINGLFIGFFGYFLGALLGLIKNTSIFSFLFLTSLTTIYSCGFMIPVSFFISVISIRRGFDPDIILYPITATLSDIFISIIFVLNMNLFFITPTLIKELLGLIFLVFMLFIIGILFFLNIKELKYRTIMSESLPIILVLAFIDNFTGTLLARLEYPFRKIPPLLVIYPALNSISGAQASMVTSRLSSDFPLGISEPKLNLYKKNNFQYLLSSIILSGVLICVLSATIGFFISDFINISSLIFNIILIIVLVNLCTFCILQLLAVIFAIIFYTRGLDPDNFGTPILTSISDLISIIFLSLFVSIMIYI